MRILRLVAEGDYAVEFHPFVTVVTGLSEPQRRQVIESFRKAAVGRPTDLHGLMEVHEVILDMDERAFAILDLERSSIDLVVDAGSLPATASAAMEHELAAAERRLAELDVPHQALLAEVQQAEADAEAARVGWELARDRLDEAQQGIEAPTGDLDQMEADLVPADEELAAADDARIDELEGVLALLASFDPGPVRSALEAARAGASAGDRVPSPDALQLADRLVVIDRRIADLERRIQELPELGLDEAASRVAEIREQVQDLEGRVAVPETIDADIAELERVHAELVAASEAVEGRFGKGKAQERLDAARQAENELLERIGLRSYTELMAGGRVALHTAAEPEELRQLWAAQREAEQTLQQLQRQETSAADLESLRSDRARLRAQARELVGADVPDDELATALGSLRVVAEGAAPGSTLVDALEAVDLPVRALDLPADELEAMAADWLDEYDRAEERRAGLERELAARRAGPAGGTPVPAPDQATVDAAQRVEDAARRAEAAWRDADERRRKLRSQFDGARVDYDATVEELATLRHGAAEMRDDAVPVDEIEWHLLARLAAQRQVSFAGSIPLVIDRALEGLGDEGLVHLLDRLERMAGAVQVVHLTDDERVVDWASSVGEDRVAVVSPVATGDQRRSGS